MKRVDDDTTQNPRRGRGRGIPHDRRPRRGIGRLGGTAPENPPPRPSSRGRHSTPRWSPGAAPTVPFLEQEAENAVTNGTVIGAGREAYTIEAEASGRKAVRLAARPVRRVHAARGCERDHGALQHPRRPRGGGLTAPLAVKAGSQTSTLA